MFYTCQDQVTSFATYVDPVDGSYFDPFYDVGEGDMQWLGKELQKTNWEESGTIALMVFGYLILAVVGFFVFPPFMICIVLTEGNLNECSLGVWGNGYAKDSSKFSMEGYSAPPDDSSVNSGAQDYTPDTAVANVL